MIGETNRLKFRKTEIRDLKIVCELEQDEDNAAFIIPWSAEKHKEAIGNEDILHLIIEERSTSKLVGYMIIAGVQSPHRNIELLRITIAEKEKGYGTEVLKQVKKWAFETACAHRLWLDVKTTNYHAFHLYKKEGFVVEGTLRECLKKEDAYESLHVLSMLSSEYKNVDEGI